MPNTISVVQKAFITNLHWQVLLLKHPLSDDPKKIWDLPGDGLNHSDGLRANLVKNVLQSTGLTITTVSIPLNVTTFLDIADRNNQVVRIIYLCQANGTIRTSIETAWIDPTQHSHFQFPDEGYHKAFVNYLSHSKLASEEFLDQGILEDTTRYLKSKPIIPPIA